MRARTPSTPSPAYPLPFNTLTQPYVFGGIDNAPTGLSAQMAYLMAQCCDLVYEQYAQGMSTFFSSSQLKAALTALGAGATVSQVASFTASEAIGFGASASTPGAYISVPFGFALLVTPSEGQAFYVIALRGTQTYQEWLFNADIFPTRFTLAESKFPITAKTPGGPGFVHGGFYAVYTRGTDGAKPAFGNLRPSGSLAAQISTLMGNLGNGALPVYITGHSLGAALASFCAMDIACNFASAVGAISVYQLAPPRASAANTELNENPGLFAENYQETIPSSFAIINAADLVPMLPQDVSVLEFEPVSLLSNTILYCAQTNSIGGNHSLTDNYLPYAQALASGFPYDVTVPVQSNGQGSLSSGLYVTSGMTLSGQFEITPSFSGGTWSVTATDLAQGKTVFSSTNVSPGTLISFSYATIDTFELKLDVSCTNEQQGSLAVTVYPR